MQDSQIEDYAFSLINDSPDMIGFAFIEEPFSRVYINPAGLKMVGLESVEDWNAHKVADLFDDADVEHLQNTVIPALKEGKTWVEESDIRNVRTGEKVRVHRRMFPIRNPDTAEVVAFGTISRDISDLKKAQRDAESARDLLVAQEERERIARDLHDSTLQQLVSMSYEIQTLQAELSKLHAPEETVAHLQKLRESVGYAVRDARRTLTAMRSARFDSSNLEQALREEIAAKAAEAGYRAELSVEGEPREIREKVQDVLLGICQESLTNTWKHGKADTVDVRLVFSDDRILLEVCDNGMGFDTDASMTRSGSGFGMVGMKERAESVGGELSIESSRGGGCTVRLTVPG